MFSLFITLVLPTLALSMSFLSPCALQIEDSAVDHTPISELKDLVALRMQNRQQNSLVALQKLPAHQKFEFSLMTFNFGLLDEWYSSVPAYSLRKQHLQMIVGQLLENKPSFVTLQEVWKQADQNLIANYARDFGYTAVIPKIAKDEMLGLMTLIKSRMIFAENSVTHELLDLPSANASVWDGNVLGPLRLAKFKRGVLRVSILLKDPNGRPIKTEILNTHWTAGYSTRGTRNAQAVRTRGYFRALGANSDLVIFGADLNSSDVFATVPKGQTSNSMWQNARAYFRAFKDGWMIDGYRTLHPNDPGYTQDLTDNPLARFSGTMTNETSETLDRTAAGTMNKEYVLAAINSQLTMQNPLRLPGGALLVDPLGRPISASDHNGVSTTFVMGRMQTP